MSALREETVRFVDAGCRDVSRPAAWFLGPAAHRTVLERARSQGLTEQDSEGLARGERHCQAMRGRHPRRHRDERLGRPR